MSRTAGQPRAALNEWTAEVLRLTTFHLAGAFASADGWWRTLVGNDPDNSAKKSKTGEEAQSGNVEEGLVLQLNSQPVEGRVDWQMGEAIDSEVAGVSVFTGMLPKFIVIMSKWLEGACPPVLRIALGVTARLPVADRDAGYRRLSDYLLFDPDPETSRDFLYQINRRRKSTRWPELELNRLAKWSVAIRTRQSMQLSPEGITVHSPPKAEESWCHAELDINTVARDTPIQRDQLKQLLEEMAQLAEEIVQEGDV